MLYNSLMQAIFAIVKARKYTALLLLVLLFSFVTKAWRINQPDEYYFDEIYYGFTAEQYTKANMDAWVFDTTAPKGFAYTWDHPPTGKLLMSVPIKIIGVSSLSRRVAPLLFGTFLTVLVYYFYLALFPGQRIGALLSALIISLDGLVLSMSRIALVDVILTTLVLCSAVFMWRGKIILSAIFFGLAVSTKWTGLYLLPVMFLHQLMVFDWRKSKAVLNLKNMLMNVTKFISIGIIIYILSYTPLLLHFGWEKFVDLQKQMYWYHTGLKATHPFQSKAYMWPLDIKPVWLWVKSGFGVVQSIYAVGNPLVFWGGAICVVAVCVEAVRTKSKKLLFLLAYYFIFWLPWVFSPRLMFIYHYLPSVPFLVVCTAVILEKLITTCKRWGATVAVCYILVVAVTFAHMYPCWTGMPIEKTTGDNYLWQKVLK